MELKLNVYKTPKEVEKTYYCETFDIMFGTVEDLISVIDLDKLDDKTELAKLVLKAIPLLKPFLKEIFEGLTDEELRHTKIKELIPLFVQIFAFAIGELNGMSTGKN